MLSHSRFASCCSIVSPEICTLRIATAACSSAILILTLSCLPDGRVRQLLGGEEVRAGGDVCGKDDELALKHLDHVAVAARRLPYRAGTRDDEADDCLGHPRRCDIEIERLALVSAFSLTHLRSLSVV